MSSLPKYYTLNNGTKIPSIGLGTAKHLSKEAMVQAVMENGYTHLDTAKRYKNEEIVGEAIQECLSQGKKREELYICTKLWHDDYNDVEAGCRESLRKL